jgi:cell division protease FtsH
MVARSGGRQAAPRQAGDNGGSPGLLGRCKRWWSFEGRAADRTALRALVGGLVVLVIVAAAGLVLLQPRTSGRAVSVNELNALVGANRIEKASLLLEDSRVVGELRSVSKGAPAGGPPPATVAGIPDGGGAFWLAVPDNAGSALIDRLAGAGVPVSTDQQGAKRLIRFVLTFFVPVLALADLFGLLLVRKGGSSGIDDVLSFGSVGDEARAPETQVTFKDIGGCPEALEELAEVRDYLRDPGRYRRLGALPPKGVLLFGPPGCGKTLLARAVAGEAGVPFYSVAGAEFVESLVGVGAARVRDLFRRVRAAAPAIVFIDELDAAGRRRMAGGGTGGSDEREQTLNQLLIEMDGFDVSSGIVVIAATNRPDILDPALLRPGRFDRHVTIERPDVEGRHSVLQIHAAGKPLAPDVDLWRLAERTPGFTGADLANVVNEAALLAIRGSHPKINNAELVEAVQRVLSGPQRRGQLLTPDEQRRASIHEVGHLIVAASLGRASEVQRLSVLGRGRALAAATFAEREANLASASDLRDRLHITLGGVAAERLVYGELSTGGEEDLERATSIARDMVARYGMSDVLGPVRLLVAAGPGYLGDEVPLADLSPATMRQVEEEVRRFVDDALAASQAVCMLHRAHVDRIADDLIELEVLEEGDLADSLAPLLAALENGTGRTKPRKTASARRA